MRRVLALTCFFASGCAALVYEIAWIRRASLVFGSTSAALATVLAVFFGGLALGSWLGGRLGARVARPLRWYAGLEAALAASALLTPWLFARVDGVYGAAWRAALTEVDGPGGLHTLAAGPGLEAVRVALVAAVLVVPTTLMGATLPLFVRQFVASRDRLARHVGQLYALNTLGAAAGTLAAGFVLLPAVGVSGCILAAAALNVAAALVAPLLRLAPGTAGAAGPAPAPASTPPGLRRALPALFFTAGFLAIGSEVLWSRFLALVIRNSVITYVLTLATVLVGIVLGSLLAARLADRPRLLGIARADWYGLVQMAAAVAAAAFVFLPVPVWRGLGEGALPIALLMLPPAVLSGALFPLANRLVVDDPARSARVVGRMTALNTVGGIAGSLAAGFLLLPHVGLATSVRLLAGVGLAAGLGALLAAGRAHLPLRLGAGVLAGLLALALPALKGARLPDDHLAPAGMLVDVAEGRGATLAAVREEGRLQLQIDRLWQGSDRKGHQIMAAHLPALLHAGTPRAVLVIGLGVGQTAGRFLMHGATRLDCVDIEPSVFPFVAANFPSDWLTAPGVTVIPEDGRSFTAHTDRRYDIVSVEVGQVFRPGVDAFYTREFYREARALLRPGGLVAQFVSLAFFDEASFDSVVRTFLEVFPHATLWYNTQELLLIGAPDAAPRLDPARLDPERLPAAAAADLRWSPWGGARRHLVRPGALLGSFLADEAVLRDLVAGGGIYTDDRPTLAYATADVRAEDHLEAPLARRLAQHLAPVARGLVADAAPDSALLALAEETRRLNVRDLVAAGLVDDAVAGRHGGRAATPAEVLAALERALELNPESFHAWYNLGKARLLQGDPAGAVAPLARAAALRPDDGAARRDHGLALLQTRRPDLALPELEAAAALRPDDAAVFNYLGAAYGGLGRYDAAEQALLRSLELDPTDPTVRRNLEHTRRQAAGAP